MTCRCVVGCTGGRAVVRCVNVVRVKEGFRVISAGVASLVLFESLSETQPRPPHLVVSLHATSPHLHPLIDEHVIQTRIYCGRVLCRCRPAGPCGGGYCAGLLCRIPRFSRPSCLHHSTARSSCTRATYRQSPICERLEMTCQQPIYKADLCALFVMVHLSVKSCGPHLSISWWSGEAKPII